MNLQVYLNRIGYSGIVEPTLSCLTAIHRLQTFTIPYENLDIQLGHRVDRDTERIFGKVVSRQRGGWCYETHELLHWALLAIGFDARLVTAGIHRNEFGDMKLGNHTAILVSLDRIYLADLGLGDGIRDPIPLSEGTYVQGKLTFRLERMEDGYWRFLTTLLLIRPISISGTSRLMQHLSTETLRYFRRARSRFLSRISCVRSCNLSLLRA